MIYSKNDILKLNLNIKKWDIIFLYWDLAAWKTTISKHIINNLLNIKADVISPTYTYYNKYSDNIYHFDLYRINNYDEFFSIWWEDIIWNDENINIIEWPNIISDYIKPTIIINIKKTDDFDKRDIEIIYNKI